MLKPLVREHESVLPGDFREHSSEQACCTLPVVTEYCHTFWGVYHPSGIKSSVCWPRDRTVTSSHTGSDLPSAMYLLRRTQAIQCWLWLRFWKMGNINIHWPT